MGAQGQHTISVTVMLYSDAQDFECMHPNKGALDPLFALENHVHRPGQ